jgi:hypothetical protein
VRIEDLLRDPRRREFAARPEADALCEPDALVEAYLVGVHSHAVLGEAWLFFDCRGALQIEMGNTAIIAAHGLRSLTWSPGPRPTDRTQWTILSWLPNLTEQGWKATAGTSPAGQLEIWGERAEFYVGDIPGGGGAPPDFGESSEDEIRAGLVDLCSEFLPVHASFTERPEWGG